MTKAETLRALADHVEKATADQQGEMLETAWNALGPITRPTPEQATSFARKLDAEAYESAALMLVPEGEGHWPQVYYTGINPTNPNSQRCRVELWGKGLRRLARSNAATPALAFCAAALRAQAREARE